MQAIDFCCGAGGMTRGLRAAGIDVRAGVDIDERLRRTYEENNPGSKLVCQDLATVDIHSLRRQVGIDGTDSVTYAACTPCQPFSTLTHRNDEADERRTLLLDFGALVRQAPPDYIVVENVPGLESTYGGEVYDEFLRILDDTGFTSPNRFQAPLNARDYGVPQERKRFILLASRHGGIVEPVRQEEVPTVRTAIERFHALEDGRASNVTPNHETRRLQDHHRRIVEAVPLDGGSRRDVQDETILLQCHRGRPNSYRNVFGRMRWDAPAPTMTCRCIDVYCGRFIHPEQHRGISAREAAAIQSFPDDYVFHGTLHNVAHQIGNAVPVELARRLGVSVMRSADERGPNRGLML